MCSLRWTSSPVLSVVLFVFLISCGGQEGKREKLVKLKLAYIAANADLPVFVAEELGLFEKHGLEVALVRANNSSEALIALLTKQVDAVGGLTFGVHFPAEVQDPGQLTLFQPFAETDRSVMSYLLAGKESGVTSIQDLKGRRIGTYTGASQLVFLKLFLEKVGLDPERDVRIIQVAMELQAQALEAGQFDVLFTIEPYGTIAIKKAGARTVLENPRSKYILNPFWVGAAAVRTEFVSTHPTVVRALEESLDDALLEIEKDPVAMKKLLPKYTPIDEELALASGLYTWYPLGEVEEGFESIQQLADLMHNFNLIDEPIPSVRSLFGISR